MKNLYIDFDGVIVDTIRVTYDMLDRLGVDRADAEKMSEFYYNLNCAHFGLNDSCVNVEHREGMEPPTIMSSQQTALGVDTI